MHIIAQILDISAWKIKNEGYEIFSTLVIKKHQIFGISKDAIGNLSTCIGKVRIRLSVYFSVIM